MSLDPSRAAGLHDLADELVDNLDAALAAARNYRDRCRSITGLDMVRDGDETYLAEQKAAITEATSGIDDSLYLLD